LSAQQLMSRKLCSATESMSVREAAEMLLAGGVSCLPVLDANGHGLGIVTCRDLLRSFLA
jgi:CBS-domain-containing membrane protein